MESSQHPATESTVANYNPPYLLNTISPQNLRIIAETTFSCSPYIRLSLKSSSKNVVQIS